MTHGLNFRRPAKLMSLEIKVTKAIREKLSEFGKPVNLLADDYAQRLFDTIFAIKCGQAGYAAFPEKFGVPSVMEISEALAGSTPRIQASSSDGSIKLRAELDRSERRIAQLIGEIETLKKSESKRYDALKLAHDEAVSEAEELRQSVETNRAETAAMIKRMDEKYAQQSKELAEAHDTLRAVKSVRSQKSGPIDFLDQGEIAAILTFKRAGQSPAATAKMRGLKVAVVKEVYARGAA